MSRLDRREFLAALAALGAQIVLPGDATPAVVDSEWKRLLEDPWVFEVDSNGRTLTEVGGEASPTCNADIYDCIYPSSVLTSADAVDLVESTPDLERCVQALVEEEWGRLDSQADEIESELRDLVEDREDDDDEDPEDDDSSDESSHEKERELSALLVELRKAVSELQEDPYGGWHAFLGRADERNLADVRAAVEAWLKQEPNWHNWESWPEGWSGQGRVLEFFRDGVGSEWVDELGVRVVEGEHPGSTYYAAELRVPIDEANLCAQRLGIPIRFRLAAVS
ncbi:MAG: hypothetical protein ACI89X_003339 [Planctomycetota bacterium]|jgi:hypothetical protein